MPATIPKVPTFSDWTFELVTLNTTGAVVTSISLSESILSIKGEVVPGATAHKLKSAVLEIPGESVGALGLAEGARQLLHIRPYGDAAHDLWGLVVKGGRGFNETGRRDNVEVTVVAVETLMYRLCYEIAGGQPNALLASADPVDDYMKEIVRRTMLPGTCVPDIDAHSRDWDFGTLAVQANAGLGAVYTGNVEYFGADVVKVFEMLGVKYGIDWELRPSIAAGAITFTFSTALHGGTDRTNTPGRVIIDDFSPAMLPKARVYYDTADMGTVLHNRMLGKTAQDAALEVGYGRVERGAKEEDSITLAEMLAKKFVPKIGYETSWNYAATNQQCQWMDEWEVGDTAWHAINRLGQAYAEDVIAMVTFEFTEADQRLKYDILWGEKEPGLTDKTGGGSMADPSTDPGTIPKYHTNQIGFAAAAAGGVSLDTLRMDDTVKLVFAGTAGTAVPSPWPGNTITFVGAGGITTSAAVQTVTIDGSGLAPTLHALLGANHSDTTAAGPTRGDVITAQAAAPNTKWTRLAISVPAATYMNYLGVANADAEPGYKALFDATVPGTIAESAAAATGSAVVAARRDHVHGAPATWTPTQHDLLGISHAHTANVHQPVLGDIITGQIAAPNTVWAALTLGLERQFVKRTAGGTGPSWGYILTTELATPDAAGYLASNGAGIMSWAATATPTAHNLLGSTYHGDTTTGTVSTGDIIVGSTAPAKWTEYALVAPAANVRNVLGVDNTEIVPTWKTALDGTNPTTLTVATVAAPGTSLIFAHRDHAHAITSSSNPGAAAAILSSTAAGLLTVENLTLGNGSGGTLTLYSAANSAKILYTGNNFDIQCRTNSIGNVRLLGTAGWAPNFYITNAGGVANTFAVAGASGNTTWASAATLTIGAYTYTWPVAGAVTGEFLRSTVAGAAVALSWETAVTSAALSMPATIFSVAGSPITSTGTFTVTLENQAARKFFIGPASGADAAPTFRVVAPSDLCTPETAGYLRASGAGVLSWELSAAPSLHTLFSTVHSDTDTTADFATGDVIYRTAGGLWNNLALAVPAAGIFNYLGVNTGETLPTWKSARTTNVASTVAARDANSYLQASRFVANNSAYYGEFDNGGTSLNIAGNIEMQNLKTVDGVDVDLHTHAITYNDAAVTGNYPAHSHSFTRWCIYSQGMHDLGGGDHDHYYEAVDVAYTVGHTNCVTDVSASHTHTYSKANTPTGAPS